MNLKKISRICWNTNDWVKPSGPDGKSKHIDDKGRKAFEYKYGYGHEEWLFETRKLINGYHYGFLESINQYRQKYIGDTYDISLYTINWDTREKFWIGEIKNANVLDIEQSADIYKEYKKRGWFNEMVKDIEKEEGNSEPFINIDPGNFANLRFKKDDLKLLEEPMLISREDKSINAYYYILLNKYNEPTLIEKIDGEFKFKPGINPKKENTFKEYRKKSKAVKLEHNQVQEQLYKYLCGEFGKNSVGTENPTGYGARVDIVVKDKNRVIFYELKTGYNLLSNVRDALTQLLEYCYYPDKINAKELIIVSLLPTNDKIEKYLKNIRDNFKIPIYYKQFDKTKKILV